LLIWRQAENRCLTFAAPLRLWTSLARSIQLSGSKLYPSLVVASFLAGLWSGYAAFRPDPQSPQFPESLRASSSRESGVAGEAVDLTALGKQVNPPDGYDLPVRYGDLGPRLLASGAIDFNSFSALYETAGDPLTETEAEILNRGSDRQIVITQANAHFLLNFFWAVGLVNKNPILTDGPLVQNSGGQIDRFASTGGWTLATRPVTELYATLELISLTPAQQARVEEVAGAIYRPCCDNPTLFPDCNHGMAMLGLLELMASQDAGADAMFEAAKYVNAFWFPQQALEVATYLEANQHVAFTDAEARLVTGKEFFSGSGFGSTHQRLLALGLVPQVPGGQGTCAN